MNLLPLVGTFLNLSDIGFDNFVYALVLLNENQQQVMGRFSYLGLHHDKLYIFVRKKSDCLLEVVYCRWNAFLIVSG